MGSSTAHQAGKRINLKILSWRLTQDTGSLYALLVLILRIETLGGGRRNGWDGAENLIPNCLELIVWQPADCYAHPISRQAFRDESYHRIR